MNLSWGVTPLMIQEETDTEALFNNAMESAEQHGYVQHGDLAVITAYCVDSQSGLIQCS